LVEFDSEYGHRRNPIGYLRCLEDADVKMRALVNSMKDDDLLIITADHGNDPTYKGTDHTREQVPFVAYSKSLVNKGHMISSQDTFACIGATIIDNFNVDAKDHQIGKSLLSMIK
jgi:phosphopentomutase